jgi:hypothetical protein
MGGLSANRVKPKSGSCYTGKKLGTLVRDNQGRIEKGEGKFLCAAILGGRTLDFTLPEVWNYRDLISHFVLF